MIPITVSTANAMLTKLHTPPIIRETVSLTAPTALTIILLTNVHANWAIAAGHGFSIAEDGAHISIPLRQRAEQARVFPNKRVPP